MMEQLRDLLAIFLTAAVFQNALLTRGLGLTKATSETYSLHAAAMFGGTLTLVMSTASVAVWPIIKWMRDTNVAARLGIRYTVSAVSLLGISVMILLVFFISRARFPHYHYEVRPLMPQIVMNCALLGTLVVSFSSAYNLLQTFAFSLGSGVGYTVALMLLCDGKRRILLSDVPRPFRGFPVMLLYLGICSMAIYGLIGHQIPT